LRHQTGSDFSEIHQDSNSFSATQIECVNHQNEDRMVVCHCFSDFLENNPQLLASVKIINLSVLQEMKCYAVIDGHGGTGCADFIHRNFLTKVLYFWNLFGSLEDVPDSLSTVLENTMFSIEEEFSEYSKMTMDNSGACIVAALYLNGWLCICNVGDSGAVFIDHQGKELKLSEDHSHHNMRELTRILKAGGKISNGYIESQLQPSRTIGDCLIKSTHPGVIIAKPHTSVVQVVTSCNRVCPTLVLASDGLWDIGWKKATYFIREHTLYWQKCVDSGQLNERYRIYGYKDPSTTIAQYARSLGSTDDISVLFTQFV